MAILNALFVLWGFGYAAGAFNVLTEVTKVGESIGAFADDVAKLGLRMQMMKVKYQKFFRLKATE